MWKWRWWPAQTRGMRIEQMWAEVMEIENILVRKRREVALLEAELRCLEADRKRYLKAIEHAEAGE